MNKVAAVVLAAGESSRLGRPKQLLRFQGKTLLRRIVDAANEAGCSPIVVVVGGKWKTGGSFAGRIRPVYGTFMADRPPACRTAATAVFHDNRGRLSSRISRSIDGGLRRFPARIVKNQNWRSGIGTSIRLGVRSLIENDPSLAAVVLLVCDQPFVDARVIKRLIAIRKSSKRRIVASAYSDMLGVPALFDRSCFDELLQLPDNSGAKPIILRDLQRVAKFPFAQGAVDIDTAADYEEFAVAQSQHSDRRRKPREKSATIGDRRSKT
jgi:molybdenum cofactor cytidylyltransferase